jgi:hypothetical protein
MAGLLRSFCSLGSFRSFTTIGLAALALTSTSCASLVGVQDTDVDFKVLPGGDGMFFGWTNITTSVDASSASSATLLAVTLDPERPEGTADLSFLKTLTGELVLDQRRQLAVVGSSFPRGKKSVALKIQFTDDLRPFFKNGTDLRVEWKGQVDPAFKAWPADGFWVHGLVKVDVE